jgi:hypothetical protein
MPCLKNGFAIAEYKIKAGRTGKCHLCGKQQSWLCRHIRLVHGVTEKELKLAQRQTATRNKEPNS